MKRFQRPILQFQIQLEISIQLILLRNSFTQILCLVITLRFSFHVRKSFLSAHEHDINCFEAEADRHITLITAVI
jgi:hypothetical protein